MSEETNKNKEIKKKPKKNDLIEQYKYVPEENEQLIIDRPSEPLTDFIKKNINNSEKKVVKSNKELYESFMKELTFFSLSLNGEVIYDSSIDKSKESPVKFENDYFVLYGRKYSYNGLKIQKINRR